MSRDEIKKAVDPLTEGFGSPKSTECSPGDEVLKRAYTQYVRDGNEFSPVGPVVLSPALQEFGYKVVTTCEGPKFIKVKPRTDELLEFPNTAMDKVIAEVTTFWTLKPNFQKLGFLHNRGILLYGPPGTGKSCLIQQVAERMIKRGDVVFFARDLSSLIECLKAFRQVEPDRKVVVVLEDLDEYVGYSEHSLLQLLDGDNSVDNVLYLGSTNYIEKFPPRLLRPGRFDRKVFFGTLPAEGRKAYLSHKLKGVVEDEAIDDLVKKTDGFSFGHLREFVIASFAFGEPVDEVVKRLRSSPSDKLPSRLGLLSIGEDKKAHYEEPKAETLKESLTGIYTPRADEETLTLEQLVSLIRRPKRLEEFLVDDMRGEVVAADFRDLVAAFQGEDEVAPIIRSLHGRFHNKSGGVAPTPEEEEEIRELAHDILRELQSVDESGTLLCPTCRHPLEFFQGHARCPTCKWEGNFDQTKGPGESVKREGIDFEFTDLDLVGSVKEELADAGAQPSRFDIDKTSGRVQMEFPDTESQEKALRVVQRLGVPYSVYECKPTKRWSDEDSIESAVDKVLGEPQEDVDPAHTVGPNWKALKPTYKANDGTTYAIYDNGGELVVSKWDPDTDAKESVAEVPYKYQDSASRSRALHQVREYVRGLLVARGGTKSVSRGVEPPPLESLQTEVVHLKTGSGKTLCDTSGDLGRRSPTYLVTSDVNEVTCTKCKAKMKRKGKRGKVKSERCSRCKSTNVEVTPLEDRPEVGVVECKSCGFHQLVDQPTRLGERVEITADHPLGDKLALWLDYKDPFDKDTLLGAGDALGAGRRGSFEITHVDIMEDPIAQFRPQNLYYLRGKVDSTEGIQYFAMMYGTDEGPRWYTFAISPNASDLPSMEDMAAEGGNPPEEPLSGVPPHGVGDAIERAVDKVLAEQGPAIHSKCVYYGSNPQREGWGKCSNPDSGSTDVKGDQPACSKFGPRKEESTRQVREQEGEPTPPKKDEKPTVWVARHKRLAVPEQFDTLVKDHGGKVVVDDVNLNTVAIEFTTQEKAEEFSQMWTNVTGETPNLNFSHQPPEYEPGKEPKSGT